jgi:hypothetical protein
MPKKTKRQKILAQLRRHRQLTPSSVIPSVQNRESDPPVSPFHFQVTQTPGKPVENVDDKEELIVIKKDLTKTLILALIAIVIELGLYRMLRGA